MLSDNNIKPSYFLTLDFRTQPPLPQLTYYKWLVVEMERFWNLVCANLTSFKFSLFFNLIFFYNFWINGVFLNKILYGFSNLTPSVKRA